MVDDSRSRPVIGVLRCHTADVLLSSGAERCDRSTHSGSSALRISSTTSWCSCRFFADSASASTAGPVRVRGRASAAPIPRTAGTSRRRRAGPPAVPGWRRSAPCPRTPHRPGSDRRNTRWQWRRRRGGREASRTSSGPSATSRSARASTTLCRPVRGSLSRASASAMRARCSSGVGSVLGDPHRRAGRARGQSGSASVNRTVSRPHQRGRARHVERQGAQDDRRVTGGERGPGVGESRVGGVHAVGDDDAVAARQHEGRFGRHGAGTG